MLSKCPKPDPKLPTMPGLTPPSIQLSHSSSRPVCITDSTARSICALQLCHYLSKNIQDGEQQAFLRHSPHPPRSHCPTCLPSPNFHCSVLMSFCATEVQPDVLCRTDGLQWQKTHGHNHPHFSASVIRADNMDQPFKDLH